MELILALPGFIIYSIKFLREGNGEESIRSTFNGKKQVLGR
jgi:hypothetical protein